MEAKHRSHKAGRIIGDILIGLAVLLAADVLLVMRLPAPSGIGAFGANMLSEVVLNLNELTKRSPVHTAPAP